jgi:hypothetical protein
MSEREPVRIGQHVWRHAIECGLLAFLATWLNGWSKLPTGAAAGLEIAVVSAAAVSMAAHFRSVNVALIMLGWLGLPGWLIYDRLTGRHTLWTSFDVLAGLTLFLIPLTAAVFSQFYGEERAAAEEEARRGRVADLRKFDDLFTRIGHPGVAATRIETSRSGRQVYLRLPDHGKITISTLRQSETAIAIALRPPLDDNQVSFIKGDHSREVILRLADHDVLAEDVPYPDVEELLTVNNPFTIGLTEDGDQGRIKLRELATLVSGVRGAGKTNLLNVLIAKLTSCVDVIVFVIDVSGTALAAPWIRPWIEDQLAGDGTKCPRPVIDWVATTREEAWIMLQALDRLVDLRRHANPGRSKIRPANTEPQFVVIGDEIADLFGDTSVVPKNKQTVVSNFQFLSTAFEVQRKGRGPAVEPVWATQRATVTMAGSGDLKSQCKLRISLGTVAEADARSSIPDDNYAVRLISRLHHPGTGIVWLPGDQRPQPWKFYRLDTSFEDDAAKLHRIAIRNSRSRPGPDPIALEALNGDGEFYTKRWERSELYQQLARGIAQRSPAPSARPAAVRTEEDKQAQIDRFAEVLASGEVTDLFSENKTVHPGRARMMSLIAERPQMGIMVAEIVTRLRRENMPVDRSTVHRWLKEESERGTVLNRHGRWFPRLDRDEGVA